MADTLASDLIMAFDRLEGVVGEFQVRQARKQPDFYTTEQGIVIPVSTPTQVSPKRPNRNTIIIANTGTDTLYIGNSYRNCQTGKTLLAGSQLPLTTRQAVWVYLPVATPESVTTVDILETLYGIAPTERVLEYS